MKAFQLTISSVSSIFRLNLPVSLFYNIWKDFIYLFRVILFLVSSSFSSYLKKLIVWFTLFETHYKLFFKVAIYFNLPFCVGIQYIYVDLNYTPLFFIVTLFLVISTFIFVIFWGKCFLDSNFLKHFYIVILRWSCSKNWLFYLWVSSIFRLPLTSSFFS